MEKEFKTIDEQIQILESKNMIIDDYNVATNILTKNNYYYLINGYKGLFLDETSSEEKFISDSKLEEIYALYLFDKKIKIHFLKYLLYIENEIDTYIAYEFSKSYGHNNYLIPNNFNYINRNKAKILNFIKNINIEINHQYRNSNKMIVHYLDNYNYIPLWVLVRILSFGKISKFYSLMKPKDQNMISRKYNLNIKEFKVMLHNLTLIRNICAHDEKLYDIKLNNRINSNVYHKKLAIEKINGNYRSSTRDIFSIIIILKLLLSRKDFEKFYKIILKQINQLKKNIKTIKIKTILKTMGFPPTYKRLLMM